MCRYDAVDFVDIKRHHCEVHTVVDTTGIVLVASPPEEAVRPGRTPLH